MGLSPSLLDRCGSKHDCHESYCGSTVCAQCQTTRGAHLFLIRRSVCPSSRADLLKTMELSADQIHSAGAVDARGLFKDWSASKGSPKGVSVRKTRTAPPAGESID
eukprot:scaffold2751_cov266-Pinguiococcus_pyrenoidosus.AAC.7